MAAPADAYDIECDVAEAISKEMSPQYSPTSPVSLELECADVPLKRHRRVTATPPDMSRKEKERAERMPRRMPELTKGIT